MKIVLLGYMGSGKTTIGKLLAKCLSVKFLDLDHYIEEAEGSTISSLFAAKGELYFRKKESFYLKQILTKEDDFVLSTGGGTPCYGENIQIITNANIKSFYLSMQLHDLTARLIKEKEGRPLISALEDKEIAEFVGKHLFERSYYYHQANVVIDCSRKSVDFIVEDIRTYLI